jgi:tetratricopeptide (TPR) repeat protein
LVLQFRGNIMIRPAVFVALVSLAGAAQAADKPLYAPAPDWVKPAPPIDAGALTDASPVLLLVDNQQRFHDGQAWGYFDTATRAASSQVVESIGTIKLPWQPDKGDLIIHRAEIIRGAEHIDLLKGGDKFSVLHREEGLEQRQLNGILTATMAVEGLRVGDVLHLSFSITQKDMALGGNVQSAGGVIADPLRVQFARLRLLWPQGDKVAWRTSATNVQPTVADIGSDHEVEFKLPIAKQPEMPDDAPLRFRAPRLIEISSFADWAAVSRVMAPLYVTAGSITPGGPLAGEVARIKAAKSDPLDRAELALELVQSKVRYLFRGMDGGNYVPQKPEQTWALRYGDCKAKTMLLLALLHELGIEAEPVMASSQLGDLVPGRLPMAGAFDHVLVRATIGGDSLWLDGTASGARLADIHDTPPFGSVLPIRPAGADLLKIAFRPAARPDTRVDVAFDERAGVDFPAPFTIKAVYRGQIAQLMHAAAQQASKEDIAKFAKLQLDPFLGSGKIVSRALSYDEASGEATITAAGIAYPDWTREDQRYRGTLDHTVSGITFDPDRARAAWHDIPIANNDHANVLVHTTITLPDQGKGFTLDGDQQLADTIAGSRIDRTTSIAGNVITIDDRVRGTGTEIPVADIAAARQRVALAKSRLLRVMAPGDYPMPWQVAEAGKREHRFDAILAAYQADVVAQPDKAEPLTDRAWFYERIYLRREAIADLTRAIALDSAANTYLWRARLYAQLGDKDRALADIGEARKLDPGSSTATTQLASLDFDRGDIDGAVALLDERIGAGGKEKNDYLASKAEILAKSGRRDEALATMDAAIATGPGNPALLNTRCWIKGTLNVALDTALKDCTRSIELGDSAAAALDSRAMVYFRMNRLDDALTDLNAALDIDPDEAGSLFMRGVIRKRMGDVRASELDLTAARLLSPRIDRDYAIYGVTP